jgi:hypothetical protein
MRGASARGVARVSVGVERSIGSEASRRREWPTLERWLRVASYLGSGATFYERARVVDALLQGLRVLLVRVRVRLLLTQVPRRHPHERRAVRGHPARASRNARARERHLPAPNGTKLIFLLGLSVISAHGCLPIGTDAAPDTATRAAGEIACARSRRVFRRLRSASPDGRPADPPPSLARPLREASTIASPRTSARETKTRAWPRHPPPAARFRAGRHPRVPVRHGRYAV